jgi:hypothetical protein
MSWVEELKPDDEVEVEIIYPSFYVNYAVETMSRFSEAASLHCKAAALLGKDSVKFTIPGITIIQCVSLKEVLAQFGVKMKYKRVGEKDGVKLTRFECDISELRRKMEESK